METSPEEGNGSPHGVVGAVNFPSPKPTQLCPPARSTPDVRWDRSRSYINQSHPRY